MDGTLGCLRFCRRTVPGRRWFLGDGEVCVVGLPSCLPTPTLDLANPSVASNKGE